MRESQARAKPRWLHTTDLFRRHRYQQAGVLGGAAPKRNKKKTTITVGLDPNTGHFDDSDLVALQENHEVVSVSEHSYIYGGVPVLALVVSYRAHGEPGEARDRGRARRVPAADRVPPEDRPLLEALRKWPPTSPGPPTPPCPPRRRRNTAPRCSLGRAVLRRTGAS